MLQHFLVTEKSRLILRGLSCIRIPLHASALIAAPSSWPSGVSEDPFTMGLLQSNLLSRHIVLLLYLSLLVCGAIVTYDFNITWVITNPDGAFLRPTIGINGQWPIPQIRATVGDGVVVNVNNQLGNQSTSLHFHGLFMNGTTHMDGPVGTSQCSIPPGSSFTYKFQVCLSTDQRFPTLSNAFLTVLG